MIKTISRKSKAVLLEAGRRIPYIVAVLLLLLFVQGARSYSKTAEGVTIGARNSIEIKKLQEKNTELLKQNKALSEQSLLQSKENSAHIDCIAEAFAEYTRTGGAVYFKDNDLTACILLKLSSTQSNTPSISTTDSTVAEPSVQNNSAEIKNNSRNSQADNRSNIKKATEGTTNFICSLPLVGRICN